MTSLPTTCMDETDGLPAACRPNFLYIGTSKSGSTWLYNLLWYHPEIYVPPEKGLYFFDGHFEHGLSWYLEHFREAGTARAIGEVSHSYLISPDAARRVHRVCGPIKLLLSLREPADRAFSDYLDLVKNGRFTGTFEDALRIHPGLIDRGRYATHLQRWIDLFGRDALWVGVFDDLGDNPREFVADMYRFLEVNPVEPPQRYFAKRMAAGEPRSRRVCRLAKRASHLAKRIGLVKLRSRIKTSVCIRGLLYRPFTERDRPSMRDETRHRLRELFADEVLETDRLLGTTLAYTWKYQSHSQCGDAA